MGGFQEYGRSQNMDYVQQVIDTLTAPGMHGRGYVAGGEELAADFIAQQFQDLDLDRIGYDYFQPFSFPVNTFPAELRLKVNQKMLVPGQDYHVLPCSPSFSKPVLSAKYLKPESFLKPGKFQKKLKKLDDDIIVLDESAFKDDQKLWSAINELKYQDQNINAIIILTSKKLTWYLSREVCQVPVIRVAKQAVTEKIKKIELTIANQFHPQYYSQNVIGLIKGQKYPDSLLVFTAHYDHLGRMGRDTYFPGANDNASGTAMLLALARHYAEQYQKPDYTLVFMAMGAEEAGLIGSQYFVANPLFPLDRINFLINLDLAGTGDEGITVVNGSIYQEAFSLLSQLNEKHQLLPLVKSRSEACNSDHCPFYQQQVPSFFIYTLGGIQAYHDIYDQAETLPLTAFRNYFQLLVYFTEALMERRPVN